MYRPGREFTCDEPAAEDLLKIVLNETLEISLQRKLNLRYKRQSTRFFSKKWHLVPSVQLQLLLTLLPSDCGWGALYSAA